MRTRPHRNPEVLGILRDVKDAIRNPYTWPGGYPKTAICNDGGLLCSDCLKKEFRNVCHSTLNQWRDGWQVTAVDVIWEGGNHCDHCNACVDAYPSDTPRMAWHLLKLENGVETLLGTYSPQDGQDVMGCDMHEWMMENDHYGIQNPDEYEWEGDSENVAVMAKQEGMPDFRFEWKEVEA